MKTWMAVVLAALMATAKAQPPPGNLDVRWDEGAADCATGQWTPLQVHAFDQRTFILRQSPCASFEANFLYLLVGNERALLVDTGAIADAKRMPLAQRVLELLPTRNGARLPLVVAHTHSHSDHREGDAQFASLPEVRIVPADLDGVRRFYGLDRWPDGVAQLDLGGRVVHVLPAPGHNPNHVVFHDDSTGLLLTGDFLLPGRLTVDDADAFKASASRIAAFVNDRPVSHVLGGHVEHDREGHLYPHGATHHPDERPLPLTKAEVLALPQALDDFNGFYASHPSFVLTNPLRNVAAVAIGVLVLLALAIWLLVRWMRRLRRARTAKAG
ncbi:MBL fold metallo-hydrolase [Lysobacter sp.]|uniref:MBL fold metallo-hydrolase n=1 Tax=Lysobacter sp. TaxID=72226 RepID=UPI002D30884D|nr:MBL fold metallo-hydrolase [Lysobacter sp.]HZX77928.1 MBL fold metallo-hydrolase [Lysobacter sp.]